MEGVNLQRGDWVPLILRTAMEPGASVTLPQEALRHALSCGFPAACVVEPGRMLGAARMLGALKNLGTHNTEAFRVMAGSDVELHVKDHVLPCVAIPRDIFAARWLRVACTRSEGVDGPLVMTRADLNLIGEDLVLLVRAGRQIIPRHILKPLKGVVPNTFLALARPDDEQEKAGLAGGVRAVAAPDSTCVHIAEERVLGLTRELRGLPPVDADRCMTLTSLRAVAERFKGNRKLVRRTLEVLELIDSYDMTFIDRTDGTSTRMLRRAIQDGMFRRVIPEGATERYETRLELELKDLLGRGLGDALLNGFRLIEAARRKGLPIGPGTETTTHLLVAWMLGLSDVDPLAWNLSDKPRLVPEEGATPAPGLHLGAGAETFLKDYMNDNRTGLAWSYDCQAPTPDALVDRLAHLRSYSPVVLETLRTRLHQRLTRIRSVSRRPKGSVPLATIEPEISALAALCVLPWTLKVYRGGLVHDTERILFRSQPVAPVEWNFAERLGFTAIQVVSDVRLDALDQSLRKLDLVERAAWAARLEGRNESKVISRAVKTWAQKHFPGAKILNRIWQCTCHQPETFADLIALMGLVQHEASMDEVVHHFRSTSRMSGNALRHHPVLREILSPMRGRLLFVEDAIQVVQRVIQRRKGPPLKGAQDLVAWALGLEEIPGDEGGAPPTLRLRIPWTDIRRALVQHTVVPVAKAPTSHLPMGVRNLRSSERKRRYRRKKEQDPPSLSWVLAFRVVNMVREALKRKRSKAPALLEAELEYQMALLEVMQDEARDRARSATLQNGDKTLPGRV